MEDSRTLFGDSRSQLSSASGSDVEVASPVSSQSLIKPFRIPKIEPADSQFQLSQLTAVHRERVSSGSGLPVTVSPGFVAASSLSELSVGEDSAQTADAVDCGSPSSPQPHFDREYEDRSREAETSNYDHFEFRQPTAVVRSRKRPHDWIDVEFCSQHPDADPDISCDSEPLGPASKVQNIADFSQTQVRDANISAIAVASRKDDDVFQFPMFSRNKPASTELAALQPSKQPKKDGFQQYLSRLLRSRQVDTTLTTYERTKATQFVCDDTPPCSDSVLTVKSWTLVWNMLTVLLDDHGSKAVAVCPAREEEKLTVDAKLEVPVDFVRIRGCDFPVSFVPVLRLL